jgi:ApaG protein
VHKVYANGSHDDSRAGLLLVSSIVHHADMFTSEAVTRGVRVTVRSKYDPQRSHPSHNRWFFLYTIRISNEGTGTVQLVSRHWVITDATGEIQEVRGPGVVGEQPVLAPGESFEYTSGCPLQTPFGTMKGTYQMVTKDGERFEAEIAPFELSEPYTVH